MKSETIENVHSHDSLTNPVSLYIASPLGFSEVGRAFLYSSIIPQIKELGIEVLDPWKLTSEEEIKAITSLPYSKERKEAWKKLNLVMGQRNTQAIQKATGVLAILDGVDVDSGTASEIGYASALGKSILGYRGDFRLSADNEGSTVNLQVEYFIFMHGGKIITEISKLQEEVKKLFLK